MSREIKFRLWDGERYWYNVAPLNNEEALTQELTDGECEWEYNNQYAVRKGIVEQSTGLKDKNGEEIYEGDIIRQLMYVLDGKECITTWVVRWNNDEFYYDLHRVAGALYGDSMLSTCESKDCEVVGNIHENPELLEDE